MIPSSSPRRHFIGATARVLGAALLALPLASTWAAPFASSRISVRTEGTGPDVILIPGMYASGSVWSSTIAAVPGYRYHVVQLSGFAGHPAGANREGEVIAPAAEEIARYISEMRLQKPAVVGHSLGGTVGLMIAARHPDAVSRLMVVDMVPYLGLLFAGPGAAPGAVRAIADRIANAPAPTSEQRQQMATDMIKGMVRTENLRQAAVADMLASDYTVGNRAYAELIATDMTPELARITVPVTVLYVKPAPAMNDAQIDAVYKASYAPVSQAVLKRIPDSAHYIMWDQPARFQAELSAFLKSR